MHRRSWESWISKDDCSPLWALPIGRMNFIYALQSHWPTFLQLQLLSERISREYRRNLEPMAWTPNAGPHHAQKFSSYGTWSLYRGFTVPLKHIDPWQSVTIYQRLLPTRVIKCVPAHFSHPAAGLDVRNFQRLVGRGKWWNNGGKSIYPL